MQIRDITVVDIRQGKNWKVCDDEYFDWENDLLENLPIIDATEFRPEDDIVYSAIYVTDEGEVKPLVLIKAVEDLDYGGDYCEFVNGKWQQVGFVPNPNAAPGNEYVANPLEQDGSFISEDDYRDYHREHFKKFAQRL
ncbi:MAG: hypothetical protein IPM25_06875 [Chloracidobacterium sp.]|nr:hypothetical protein [Chloracidobacterium sp.]